MLQTTSSNKVDSIYNTERKSKMMNLTCKNMILLFLGPLSLFATLQTSTLALLDSRLNPWSLLNLELVN